MREALKRIAAKIKPGGQMTFIEHLKNEFSRFFTDKAVIISVLGGVLFYAALYPQPYLNQLPRQQSIAVVDHDNTPASRRLIRYANAAPQVHIVDRDGYKSVATGCFQTGGKAGLRISIWNPQLCMELSANPSLSGKASLAGNGLHPYQER